MDQDSLRTTTLERIKTIDKAINLECNAQVFYANASEQVDSVEGKKTFRWLADFEANHEAKLKKIRQDLIENPALSETEDPGLNMDLDISETGSDRDIDPNISDVDILILALDNEKRAKAFYERKAAAFDDGPIKEMLLTFAGDEAKHVRILQGQIEHVEVNRKWAKFEAIVDKSD